jgi:hypothetical protein
MKNFLIFLSAFPAVLIAQPKFGVLVNGKMNLNIKINVAKALDISYIRDAVVLQNWNGNDESTDKFMAEGFKVILNVNWGQVAKGPGIKEPVPFPTDTVEYKKVLDKVLNKYKPEVIVIENEETTRNYHTGPIEDYISELSAAITVAHSKGLKITNGGITNRDLVLLVYNDYLERKMNKEADDFASRCVKPALLKNLETADIVAKAKKLIEAYKNLPLDYINIHLYEPVKNVAGGTDESVKTITPGAQKEMINYIERVTGKRAMSNETGTRTSSPKVVTGFLQQLAQTDMPYVIWFSGDGEGGSVALHNQDGSLRPNGIAFKNFIMTYNK